MAMKVRIGLALVIVGCLGAAGCASDLGGGSYERTETRRVMQVRMGVVESVRQVRLEGTESGVGVLAGTAIGGIAGSNVGGNRGSMIGGVLGAVAGGIAGAAAEQLATKKMGLEITVKLDSGDLLAVIQEADDTFQVGDRVRLLSDHRTTRVSH
jgi:outer membrane lipoprotein SlyB